MLIAERLSLFVGNFNGSVETQSAYLVDFRMRRYLRGPGAERKDNAVEVRTRKQTHAGGAKTASEKNAIE